MAPRFQIQRLRRASLAVGFALSICAAAQAPAVHIRNFDKVNDHIYRGGEPSQIGIEELGAMGVKTVIDLRVGSEGTASEKQQVEKLKIKYINIPIGEFSAPSTAQIEQLLSLLQTGNGPVFVHCRRGKDRTGTVVACYRIQHDGWDNRRALEEAQQHGMSNLERSMRAYILHFSPLSIPAVPASTALTPAGVLK